MKKSFVGVQIKKPAFPVMDGRFFFWGREFLVMCFAGFVSVCAQPKS